MYDKVSVSGLTNLPYNILHSQLEKIQDCILEILVTAQLESINLFIAVFDTHVK